MVTSWGIGLFAYQSMDAIDGLVDSSSSGQQEGRLIDFLLYASTASRLDERAWLDLWERCLTMDVTP
jgi:hypothetical protein